MPRTVLLFADCRLDPAARALWRDGARVELPPTVFDCLAYLLTHRERAVGRDELVAAVWGKTSISDTMLGKAILAARRAVGDSADAQACLRTVPRFGYHWVGAVREEVDVESAAAPGVAAVDLEPRSKGGASFRVASSDAVTSVRMRRLAVLATVVAAVAAVGAWYLLMDRRHPASADIASALVGQVDPALSIVLPVDVVGGPEDAWLRLGLMDLIANRLRAADLPVMSSDSVVGLLRQEGASAATIAAAVRRDSPHANVISIAVARSGGDWTLHAEVATADRPTRPIDAHGSDAVAVARSGADRLVELFGKRVPGSAGAEPLPLDVLLQRTEAARLADEVDVARGLIEAAPADLRALPDVRLRSAQIDIRAGDFEAAQKTLDGLLAELPAETEPVLRARALVTLSNVQGRLDDPQAAIASASAAIRLVETADAPQVLAIAYNNRAITHARQRNFDEAEADFARARVAFERSGDRIALIRLDGNEASATIGRGRPAEALPMLARAGERFEQFGLFNEALIAVANEVDASLQLLQSASALAASERGWTLLSRVRDPNLQHDFRRERAAALAANGRTAEAHVLLEELVGSIDPDREAGTLGLTRADLAMLELEAGHAASAAVLAGQALIGLPSAEYRQARAEAALTQIRALRGQQRLSEANAELTRLLNQASDLHAPLVGAYAELAAAEQANASGAAASARDAHFERAQEIATELNLPFLTAAVADSYARVLITSGELERAAVVVGRVARYAETDFRCALLQTRLYLALGQRDAWQAALARSRALAGERPIPAELSMFPVATAHTKG